MQLSFLGGAKEVGRSAILVDTDTEKILLDYGLKMNVSPLEYPKNVDAKLNAIFISHAHLDHNGAIPLLFHQGQRCPIFCKDINRPFSRMLLYDSYKISRYEGEKERFQKKDIKVTLSHFKTVDYKQPIRIGKSRAFLHDGGHIPGSAMILLESQNKRILYTGDFNTLDSTLIKGADKDIPEVDVLITESTYAQREHPDREKEERIMIETIKGTLSNDGIALVSCFAISRAQEILLILDEYELDYPVYLDGMAYKATKIINSYPGLQREYNQVKKAMQRLGVKPIKSPQKRKKIIKQPCIIVTTSGMLTGGPISYYLEKLWDREDCSLILTGFQVPGTEGAILLETGNYIHNDLELPLKMYYKKFDFSSHASRSELFKFVKKVNPGKVFCVHGDNTEGFARDLKEEHGFDAISPKSDKIYSINP